MFGGPERGDRRRDAAATDRCQRLAALGGVQRQAGPLD
jgi:hypothetical protein